MSFRRVDPAVQRLWEQLEDAEEATVMERRRLQDIWKKISAMHKENAEVRETFEKEAALDFVPGDERIVLNVGGHIFETTAGVLCRDRYSLLACMCKAVPQITKDAEGAFFVDRDWWIFRYILLFLRTGSLPEDQALLREMYDEAAFYRLNSLRRAVQRRAAAAPTTSFEPTATGPKHPMPSTGAYAAEQRGSLRQAVRSQSSFPEALPDPFGFRSRYGR